MPRDTGFPGSDAQFDFNRARRRRALARLANTIRREPDDVEARPRVRAGASGQ